MTRWIWSIFFLALIPWAEAQQQAPIFRVRTEQVTVYVSVTDKKGRPVKNLSREDFQILEDGALQQIDLFQEIDWGRGSEQPLRQAEQDRAAPGNLPQAADPALPPPSDSWRESRYVVIRFDPGVGRTGSKGRYGVSFDKEEGPASGFGRRHEFVRQTKRAMEAAREVVEQLDLSSDYAAVSWRNLLTEFTQDKQRLLDLIDALDPSKMDQQDAGARLADVVAAEIGGVGSFELSDIFDQPGEQDAFFEIDRQIMLGSHFDGADLISRLKYLRGRKVLIYLGEGLPEVSRDDKDLKYFDPRYNARIYSDAGFTVYAISPRGLAFGSGFNLGPVTPGSRRGMSPRQRSNMVFRFPSSNGLENIYLKRWTEVTGGMAYYNRNNLKKGVREVFEQASHSYLMAYRTGRPEPDGKFHRIQVRWAEGKGRGARVRHR
ncbi:MAG: VWA domain-containing protein, partial [Acidobacteriota bacterium]